MGFPKIKWNHEIFHVIGIVLQSHSLFTVANWIEHQVRRVFDWINSLTEHTHTHSHISFVSWISGLTKKLNHSGSLAALDFCLASSYPSSIATWILCHLFCFFGAGSQLCAVATAIHPFDMDLFGKFRWVSHFPITPMQGGTIWSGVDVTGTHFEEVLNIHHIC